MRRPALVLHLLTLWLGTFGLFLGGSAPAQPPAGAAGPAAAVPVLLKVGGEVERALELAASDLARIPRISVKATDHDGEEIEYSGVPLVEVLKLAGVKLGKELRGPRLADFLLVEAAGGYKAVFALPEIDPAFSDRVVLLADQANGKPLSARDGPLKIVVPGEKQHARWVRQVTAISVLHAR